MQDFATPLPDHRLLRLLEALDLSAELTWAPGAVPEGARWTAHLPVLAWLLRTQRPSVLVDASGDAAGLSAIRQLIAERDLPTHAVAAGREGAEGRRLAGGIDLLRLAPASAQEAQTLFETWRGRLSDRAVLLCHGTALADGDTFSTVWREWAASHPAFEFPLGGGVGILAVGTRISPTLDSLFELHEAEDGAEAIRKIFAMRGAALCWTAERAALTAELALQGVTGRQRLDECRAEIRRLQHDVRLYRESASWRITAPVRRAIELVRKLRRPPQPNSGVRAGDAIGSGEVAKAALRRGLAERLQQFLAGDARLRLPADAAPEVSILVVLHNAAELTFGCLGSIVECLGSDASAEVIIFDNASNGATEQLLARVDGAKVIRSAENLHFLRGVNLAARAAAGANLLLLNNDVQLLPGSLPAAQAALRSAENIGAVGGRIVLPDGTLQEAGCIVWRDGTCAGYARGRAPDDAEAMFRRDVDFCSGAFLLTPRAVFERLGGFDERFAPAYYEDADYCVRLRQHGLRVVYEPDAVVRHYEFGSAADAQEALQQQQRNRATFAQHHRAWLATQLPDAADNVLAARQARDEQPRVLVIEDRVPHPRLGAGYPRANDFVRTLADHAHVTLFPMQRFAELHAGVRAAVPAGVEVLADRDASRLAEFLHQRRGFFGAIVVARPHNLKKFVEIGGAEPASRGDARLIYDAEAILAAREGLRRQTAGMPLSSGESEKMLAEEMALARRADVVLAVSAAEQRVFAEHGVADVQVLGHALRPAPTEAAFERRKNILFVGAVHEDWTPNADGLRWFAEDILPILRRALGMPIRLKVVGENHVAAISELDGTAFELVGSVQDLRPHYKTARLVVAPTRFAAGLPHKVAQAAAHGVPVVATELLARQLGWQPGRDLLAASDATGFAAACARLYNDPALWRQLRASALDRVREDCAPETFDAVVARLVRENTVRR